MHGSWCYDKLVKQPFGLESSTLQPKNKSLMINLVSLFFFVKKKKRIHEREEGKGREKGKEDEPNFN